MPSQGFSSASASSPGPSAVHLRAPRQPRCTDPCRHAKADTLRARIHQGTVQDGQQSQSSRPSDRSGGSSRQDRCESRSGYGVASLRTIPRLVDLCGARQHLDAVEHGQRPPRGGALPRGVVVDVPRVLAERSNIHAVVRVHVHATILARGEQQAAAGDAGDAVDRELRDPKVRHLDAPPLRYAPHEPVRVCRHSATTGHLAPKACH